MSVPPLDQELIKLYRKEQYETNSWTHDEQVLRNRPKIRNQYLAENIVTFNKAVNEVVRQSFFGIFLKFFNPQHNQNKQFNEDKLAVFRYQLTEYEPAKLQNKIKRNKFTECFHQIFMDAIKYADVIDWDWLYDKIQTMRIASFDINTLDRRMKCFGNLQVLVLSGNWVTEIDGKHLPRKLLFLELYANQIKSVEKLCNNPPKSLLYLGLGRNQLDDRSSYHLMAKSKNLRALRCIDFSNNDIYTLDAVVEHLRQLPNLVSLMLEGNPCWVLPLYKDIIIKAFPDLKFLDYTEIIDTDKLYTYDGIFDGNNNLFSIPEVAFYCFRILSIPPPPKQKGAQSFFHIEVSLPLLEEIIIPAEIEDPEKSKSFTAKSKSVTINSKSLSTKTKSLKKKSKSKQLKSKSSKITKGKSTKSLTSKSKLSKHKKGKSNINIYAAPDEHQKEKKSKTPNTRFKSERKPWDKIIEFPPMFIPSPENDFGAIRDCFRSRVNVKIIYELVEPPVKGKKGKHKDKKKNKKGDKKSSKGSKEKMSKGKKSKEKIGKKKKSKEKMSKVTLSLSSKTKSDIVEKEPEETILKKVTIANFFCDLHLVNWSDNSVDFYWANHPKANPVAIPVEGSLQALNYQVKGKEKSKSKQKEKALKPKKSKSKNTKGSKKSKTDKSKSSITKDDTINITSNFDTTQTMKISKIGEIEPIGVPHIFTCEVGFGLKRF